MNYSPAQEIVAVAVAVAEAIAGCHVDFYRGFDTAIAHSILWQNTIAYSRCINFSINLIILIPGFLLIKGGSPTCDLMKVKFLLTWKAADLEALGLATASVANA